MSNSGLRSAGFVGLGVAGRRRPVGGLGVRLPTVGGGGGGGGLVSGMSAHFEADQITGFSDGAALTTWADASGSGLDLTEATNPPIYRASQVNSLPAVEFQSGDRLGRDNVRRDAIADTDTAVTWFLVMWQNSSIAQARPFQWRTTSMGLWGTYNDTFYWDAPESTARVSGAQPAGWDNAWHIVECVRDGANAEIMVDGTVVASRTNASGSFGSAATTARLAMGENTLNSAAFVGYMAAAIIYPTALSSEDRTTNRDYLASKYGITVA